MNDLKLCMMAVDIMNNSYSPYSHFKVGAALLCADGSVYTGVNIENSSYGDTICAERSAFAKAISDGKREFEKIAIVGSKTTDISKPCLPCGSCRQVMAEFCKQDFEIITLNDGAVQRHTLKELLPCSFELER